MLASSASPAFPIDVRAGPGLHVERSGTSVRVELGEPALLTAGAGSFYTVATPGRVSRLRDGLTLLVRIDRANLDVPSLDIDGTGARPWTDLAGIPLTPGALVKDTLQRITYDAQRGLWASDMVSGLTGRVFDAAARLWWLSLPTSPEGIGPNAPWRNGGTLAWTDKDNPAFTIDSPEGRRLTLRLIKDALPLSSDGLNPGDPWLNGDTIAFVPNP